MGAAELSCTGCTCYGVEALESTLSVFPGLLLPMQDPSNLEGGVVLPTVNGAGLKHKGQRGGGGEGALQTQNGQGDTLSQSSSILQVGPREGCMLSLDRTCTLWSYACWCRQCRKCGIGCDAALHCPPISQEPDHQLTHTYTPPPLPLYAGQLGGGA